MRAWELNCSSFLHIHTQLYTHAHPHTHTHTHTHIRQHTHTYTISSYVTPSSSPLPPSPFSPGCMTMSRSKRRSWSKVFKCRPTEHQSREDLAVIISVTGTEGTHPWLIGLYLQNYLTTALLDVYYHVVVTMRFMILSVKKLLMAINPITTHYNYTDS